VKIGDFGLTVPSMLDPGNKVSSEGISGMHKSNVGTPLYMAPEISDNKGYGFEIDVYAIGIIYFELLRKFHT
jgi:serine/threonine protein kinase